jgi:hypothetical protein
MTGEDGLRRLEAQIAKDLDQPRDPERSWVRPRRTAGGEPIDDAVIVGGGQGGLLVGGITSSLFAEGRDEHVASLRSFAEQEF